MRGPQAVLRPLGVNSRGGVGEGLTIVPVGGILPPFAAQPLAAPRPVCATFTMNWYCTGISQGLTKPRGSTRSLDAVTFVLCPSSSVLLRPSSSVLRPSSTIRVCGGGPAPCYSAASPQVLTLTGCKVTMTRSSPGWSIARKSVPPYFCPTLSAKAYCSSGWTSARALISRVR